MSQNSQYEDLTASRGNIIQLLSALGITDTSQIEKRNFDIDVN
ncbi:hypothetical protein Tco_1397957, partial [Tanacetum coccineum]